MVDVIVAVIVVAVVSLALGYIIKAKKRGVKCIGCPGSAKCAGGENGCCCSSGE